ncbi:hypothetical protein [Microlunatus speluncae]|uniref:hypothetical protein n=1 Tax=Microlunatus speluncae TaxID=2594267 RepID=UPI00126634A9|nr:hypothetical protein [Microlunatus speluncae]
MVMIAASTRSRSFGHGTTPAKPGDLLVDPTGLIEGQVVGELSDLAALPADRLTAHEFAPQQGMTVAQIKSLPEILAGSGVALLRCRSVCHHRQIVDLRRPLAARPGPTRPTIHQKLIGMDRLGRVGIGPGDSDHQLFVLDRDPAALDPARGIKDAGRSKAVRSRIQ